VSVDGPDAGAPAPVSTAPTALLPAARMLRAVRSVTWSVLHRCAWVLAVALAVVPAAAQSLVAVPPLQARVTDLTGTLTPAQREQLESELAAIEQQRGAQVAVLMVPTTQPEAIEQYSIRVVEAWRIGRGQAAARRDTGDRSARAIDDGVLLLVAKDDRRARIEVGYGLEGAIPDAIARRIIAESMTPRFRAGDFHGGLLAAIGDISRRIAGEDLPAPWQPGAGGGPAGGSTVESLLPLVVMSFFLGVMLSRWAGRFLGATVGGGGAGLAATGAFTSLGLGAAVGAAVFLMVLMMGGGGRGGGGGRLRRLGRRTIGDGPIVIPGGGWGGGGSGGGFGGGGFGGGGGGFGGGGASGDW
jgi:uncharacterized protein